ncbi:MAG: hypothetical protein IJT30_10750, partial [Muribaculaceae bacterium]|nr:hypothetical protein [Muribaculaceae bacterium]
ASAPGLREARTKLAIARMNRDEHAAYRRYLDDRVILQDQLVTARGEGRLEGKAEGIAEGRAEGRAEGMAEGITKGRAEGIIQTARNMLGLGMEIETIARATGLEVSQIEALRDA